MTIFNNMEAKNMLRMVGVLALVAILFLIAPDALAQSLPQPPDGMGGQSDGDWMGAIGKLVARGAGIVLVIVSIGAAIGALWYIVATINNIRLGKADMAALGMAVLIAAAGLGISALFANYGMTILDDNKSFLEGS
ncbi:hypothetical protein [Denitratimonas sp. CY0512]|jgi:choline-glycine betaine transporter|uniref:hypothetical protein n=1 Tax=Denitratimonas sp. CY0512 TaxID=3131940 RepID=UPI0030ADB2F8